jgi:ubiquinone/menaquinone biosynthesis C-methylase UbiE
MTEAQDPSVEEERERLLDNWERASAGWARQADQVREFGMPVAVWMIEHAQLQPGQRVLELAAGPGDVGFMAAEQILPGGTLVSSDHAEGMVELAKTRAAEQGIENVEFRQLQLEWIDLPTASVDAILCRWGVMLLIDPAAALQECRRVLRPGGRLALAVWDLPEANPWATVPQASLVRLGVLEPPTPGAAGMFSIAQPGQLEAMLKDAGFVEITVEAVPVTRAYEEPLSWLGETIDCSQMFNRAWSELDDERRQQLRAELDSAAREFSAADGTIRIPGSSLAAVAHG